MVSKKIIHSAGKLTIIVNLSYANGDSYGDFRGVIETMDYLESLGINMVWMNPFFKSPMVDNG